MTEVQILGSELVNCGMSIKYLIAYESDKYVDFRDTQKTLC